MNFRLLVWITLCLGAAVRGQESASLNDQAKFLAGLPVRDSALDRFAHERLWVEHASAMDAAFNKTEQRQIAKVRAWAKANVPASGARLPMYYMFSGPDFLYANTFYPNASTYIMCGTEPVGAVPDIARIAPDQLDYALQALRLSMKTMLSFHYFITKEMRADLNRTNLGGTLPILYVFLARAGYSINEVTYVNTPSPGVRISFGKGQTLYYFKTDLSNGRESSNFLRWCGEHGQGLSLLKAASYLLHSDSFSNVRGFLLQNSKVIIQDDSGIPFHDIDRSRFGLRLFGTYTAPIELFAKNFQPDLAHAYTTPVPPLGFAFGYHWELDKGVLMVAEHE